MAKGVTSKRKNEENKRREEQQKPHSEQKQTTQKQKPGQSKPQNETPVESKPATQEVTPKPVSTEIPKLDPKYSTPERIEAARDFGRRSLEMAQSGQLKDETPVKYGVEGMAEAYQIPKLDDYEAATMPTDNNAYETTQEAQTGGKGHRPVSEPTPYKNTLKNAQRDVQPDDLQSAILGTARRSDYLSEEGQRQIDKLNRRIASLQNTPMTGDAAIDEVTQRNNEREIANLQRQISAIYDNDQADDTSNIERYLDPNYRMTKYEENNAERIFDEYLENNPKAKELYNTTDAAMSSLLAQRMSPEEADEYAKMVALKNKTSELGSAGLHMVESMPFVKGLADKSAKAYDKMNGTNTSEYDYSNQLEQTQTQNPLASTGGNMAYQLGQYAAFAPLVEGIPVVGKVAAGLGGKFKNPAVAKAVESIVAGQAADTLLDTLPNEVIPDIMEGNWRDLPKDILKNQGTNLAFNVFGEGVGALAKNLIPSLKNADEVVDAVKQEELNPLDLAKQNEIDASAMNAERQHAVEEIENLTKQAEPSLSNNMSKEEMEDVLSELKQKARAEYIQATNQNSETPLEDIITNDVRKLLQEYSYNKRNADYTDSIDTLRYHEGKMREILNELKQKAPDLFDADGRLRKIPEALIYKEDTSIPKEITDYVQKREDLINRTQAVFADPMTPEEVAQTFRSVNAMDEYMNQKYPEYFKDGQFIGLDNISKETANVPEQVAKQADVATPKPEKVETPKLNDEEQRLFDELNTDYDGSRNWWKDTIDRAQAYINEGGDPNVASNALAELERLERESEELINLGGTPTWTMPKPSQQLDGVAARINQTLDNVSLEDETIAKEAGNIRKAIDNYRTSLDGDSLDAINQARKDLYNACKRFDTRAKKISLEGYDGLFGKKSFSYNTPQSMGVGSPQKLWQNIVDAEENNQRLLAGIEPEDTLGKLLNGETLEETAKATPEVEAPKTEVIKTEGPGNPPNNNEPIDLTMKPSDEVKERGTSEHIRSIEDVRVATPMKMEGVSDEVVADFIENPDMYKVLKNKDTKALADGIYNSGDEAIRIGDKVYTGDVEAKFRKLLQEKNPSALPLGHQLAKDYSAAGNHEMAAELYRKMGEALTESGQFSQAAAINMMRDDPLTALMYAEKQLDAINQQGAKRFGKKWQDLSLTDDEIEAFNSIAPGDSDAIKALYDKIGARLGKEYPTTFMEKLLEGRKVAMLFNVRTNVRNVGANIPTLGMRWISDRVEALGQTAIHLIDPNFKRTQALTGSGIRGRKIANEIFNSDKVQALIKGQSGKYEIPELKNALMNDRQMYKGTFIDKWINRMTNGGIEKLNKNLFGKEGVESGLETIRNATYKLLDLGDSPFVKENFVERLGSYIHANNIKDVADVPEDAIELAWEEAMRATYKDNSWAVKMLRGFKQGFEDIPVVGRPISQAAIPFVQAPGNIAARMVDYSPIKATKGVGDIIAGAARKDQNAVRRGIEEVSKGLTGSGMVILGMKLRDAGIITGDYSSDKDQRNFEKQTGFKPWALHIGDKYFTYDWAQPFAEPMLVGTLLSEALHNSDEYDSEILNKFGIEGSMAGKAIGVAREGAKASVNSWFDASPLQGMSELLKSDYSGKTDVAQNVWDTGVSDFAGAFIPSLVNATAKTMDPVMRNTTDPSNRFATFLNQQQAKIPGLSDNLPVKYDLWGDEMRYADSNGEAFAQRFVIPGDYGTYTNNALDNEINRLFETTNDAGVFPQTAPNKVGDRELNNRDVSNYQHNMGQRSKEIVSELIKSDQYKNMTEDQRVAALKTIYGMSKAITERDLFGKDISNSDYKKFIEAFDDNDNLDGVMYELEAKYNPYGLSSDEYKAIAEDTGDFTPYEGYAEALAEYGVESKKAYREAWLNGGAEALANEIGYQADLSENNLSDSKTNREAWENGGIEGLNNVVEQKQAAIDMGFTKSDGTANMDAYNKVADVVGEDPAAIQKYVGYRDAMERAGYTKQEDFIPQVEYMTGVSPEQKGQYLALYGNRKPTEDSMGKNAYAAYQEYGYEGYYYYKALQFLTKDYPTSKNPNGDGKIDTYDRIQQLYDWGFKGKTSDEYNFFLDLEYKK